MTTSARPPLESISGRVMSVGPSGTTDNEIQRVIDYALHLEAQLAEHELRRRVREMTCPGCKQLADAARGAK
jgi:hypothetical protein